MEEKATISRCNLVDNVVNLYGKRESQKNVATKVKISVGDVGKITRAFGYSHGVLAPVRNAIIFLRDFSFLEKYGV